MTNYRERMPHGVCHHRVDLEITENEVRISTPLHPGAVLTAPKGSVNAEWFERSTNLHNAKEDHFVVAKEHDGQRGGKQLIGDVYVSNSGLPEDVQDKQHGEHSRQTLTELAPDGGLRGRYWMRFKDPHRKSIGKKT